MKICVLWVCNFCWFWNFRTEILRIFVCVVLMRILIFFEKIGFKNYVLLVCFGCFSFV